MGYNIYKKATKMKRMVITIVVITIAAMFMVSAYGVYSFFTMYGLRTPIILQSPIYQKNSILISPIASKSASMIFDVGKIADKIYTLESSNGKNDSCRNLGLYNGYGFRQNSFEWICYSSREEVRSYIINWLTLNIKNGNIEEALCYYNQGIRKTNCTYVLNYNTL